MAKFNRNYLDSFLGAVRKYMQVRGGLAQKDLAELTDVGVSTMSRFLGKKTQELDAQLIAKIAAKLEIPMHEIIDFVNEEYGEQFLRLVKFYKEEDPSAPAPDDIDTTSESFDDSMAGAMGTAQRTTKAKVRVGGKTRTIPFSAQEDSRNSEKTVKELLEGLTPRQKAYMNDFLHLDMEGKDLMVDLGNSLFRYFRQKGMEL